MSGCTECESILDICDGCLRSEYNESMKTIQRQAKIISLLKQSNSFYADKENWEDDNINYSDTEIRKEIYQEKELTFYEGGKLARQIKQQVEEMEREV